MTSYRGMEVPALVPLGCFWHLVVDTGAFSQIGRWWFPSDGSFWKCICITFFFGFLPAEVLNGFCRFETFRAATGGVCSHFHSGETRSSEMSLQVPDSRDLSKKPEFSVFSLHSAL